MRESALQSKVIDEIRRRGGYVVKIHQTGRGRRGVADLIGAYRQVALAIECKAPDAAGPTKAQQRELAAFVQSGGVAIVARSVERVRSLLDELDRRSEQPGIVTAVRPAGELFTSPPPIPLDSPNRCAAATTTRAA